jgi:hypothetical protein
MDKITSMTSNKSFDQTKARVAAICTAVQLRFQNDVEVIQNANFVCEGLQSFTADSGKPDEHQMKTGAVRFGAKWYLTSHTATRLTLQSGRSAISRLQREIQRQCNEEGIDVAFPHGRLQIRMPQTDIDPENKEPD